MKSETPNNDSAQNDDQISERSEIISTVHTDSRQSWLKGRINLWRESGLISDEQSESIINFEAAPEAPIRLGVRFSRLIVVLSTLGAILIGAGIISFVAANWQGIPAIAKLGFLIVGQTATYLVAYQFQFVRGYPRVGGAIMFAGAAWFGANVFLVAQSYHLSTDNPDLLIWWFIGVLPLAYIARSKAITVMAVGIFVVGISWKAASQTDDAVSGLLVTAILLFAGAAIYSVGLAHMQRASAKFFAAPYMVGGALLAIIVTYMFTFAGFVNDYERNSALENFEVPSGYIALAAVVSAITIVSLMVANWKLVRSEKRLSVRLAEPAIITLTIIAGWFMSIHMFESAAPYVILFNLLLIIQIFGIIGLGVINKREAFVNIGIVFFVIDLSTRYIELTVDMLGTSLAFIIGGLLLLGVGYSMERARRRLLRQFGMMEATQ
ncbi:MAG: DUF2157 domain-containing protein [Dehalococcoidia bacterium]|nr:DUF2157 domain-containing protein [Dehalococcoidia bacterium]